MFLDSYIPFIDFAVYGYISWVPLAAVSVIFLFFCPGDGYYRLIIAIAISVLICLIISLSYPVRMDIPHFGDSAFLVAVLKNSGIASFPNIPSCILSNGFFLMIFYKKIHKRSKCLQIVLLFGLILLAWIVCALLSKMTHISDLLIGILIGAVGGMENLLDYKTKDQDKLLRIKYAKEQDRTTLLFENQHLIKTPVVRNGNKATAGYEPGVWKEWEGDK
jgi:arsenate reductase-like glutaredoxin family protein